MNLGTKSTIGIGFLAGLVLGMMGLWYLEGPSETLPQGRAERTSYVPQLHPLVIVSLQLLVLSLVVWSAETDDPRAGEVTSTPYLNDAI